MPKVSLETCNKLHGSSVKQLRARAASHNIRGRSKMKKAELITAIANAGKRPAGAQKKQRVAKKAQKQKYESQVARRKRQAARRMALAA